MQTLYNQLFSDEFFNCEESEPYFQEKTLQVIWNEQLFREPLRTENNDILEVLDAGTWNLEAGPDFRNAAIRINGVVIRGDVEIHFRPCDWEKHGHHLNENYNNVILHVVWDNPRKLADWPAGVPIYKVRDSLSAPLSKILDRNDIVFYPYANKVRPGEHAAYLASLDNDRLTNILNAYGLARMMEKARTCAEKIETYGAEESAYRLLLEVIGYKNNRVPFAELADQVPLADLQSYNEATGRAVLFGAAGLLPDPSSDYIHRRYTAWVGCMWDDWWSKRKEYKPIRWTKHSSRPYNSPERRLLAAHHVLKQNNFQLGRAIIKVAQIPDDPKKLFPQLKALFVTNIEEEFRYFLDFQRILKKPAALLGTNRIHDLVVNFAVPFILAQSFLSNDRELSERCKRILLMIPKLQDNRVLKEAVHRSFVPPTRAKEVVKGACAQQGLIRLYNEFNG